MHMVTKRERALRASYSAATEGIERESECIFYRYIYNILYAQTTYWTSKAAVALKQHLGEAIQRCC